ncbi:MAG: TetR/AcrR family transcriptional regulator [Rhodothermales bacterium]
MTEPVPMGEQSEAERKIFEAARDVFHVQGYEGARMQEIADRAGINKAMLHYYYRSKEKLFEAVFRVSAMKVLPTILGIVRSDAGVPEKIAQIVHAYIDLLSKHPHVPGFIIQELRRNPGRLRRFIGQQAAGVFDQLSGEVDAAVDRGEIRPIKPEHLLANLIGLCVFPFIARPMLETVTGLDETAYDAFIEERKEVVTDFILHALKPT